MKYSLVYVLLGDVAIRRGVCVCVCGVCVCVVCVCVGVCVWCVCVVFVCVVCVYSVCLVIVCVVCVCGGFVFGCGFVFNMTLFLVPLQL